MSKRVDTVALCNRHPQRALPVPLGNGHCRLLPPGAATLVPPQVLRSALIKRLLGRGLLVLIDAGSCDADARQARAVQIDIAAAVRRAAQAEFDRLLRNSKLPPRRALRRRPKGLGRPTPKPP
jgi:hypothetical protein